MKVSDGGGSWSPTTNFEQFSHAQLFDMVNESSPASISSIANTLNSASTQIQSIADDLNAHINQLQWDGPAADSFRTWGRQVVQAVDDLAIFHNNAGLAVQTAGDTLSSVKAGMPPVPTGDISLVQNYVQQESRKIPTGLATVVNGRIQSPVSGLPSSLPGQISQSDAYAAQARIDAAHQEAVTQMEKLGGAYNGATQTMDINTEPQFPPTPAALMPPPGKGLDGSTTRAGSGGSTSSRGRGFLGPASGAGGGSGGGPASRGKSVRQASPEPGQSGGSAKLQDTHNPTAGSGAVKAPDPSGGSSTGHGSSGSGTATVPPGAGTGVLTPPEAGRGSGSARGGGGAAKGEPQPGEHPVEPGTGAGTGGGPGRGGLGGGTAGRSSGSGGGAVDSKPGAPGTEGGPGGSSAARSMLPGAEGGSARAGGAAGVTAGGGASGSPTARAGRPTVENADVRPAAGEPAGGSVGPMMGGGMGGLGHAGGRGRGRSRRAPYYTEDAKTWATDSTGNPAVVPSGESMGAGSRGSAAEVIGGGIAGASSERPGASRGRAEVSPGAAEETAGATTGGPMVGSMGGLSRPVRRHRGRGRRGSHYAHDDDLTMPAPNPAVIE